MSGTELEYLRNLRKGIRLSVEVLQAGFCPFSPFINYSFFLALREEEEDITGEQIKAYSLVWLESCDALLLVPGYEHSKGTLAEIARAQELGIPIFTSLSALIGHFELEQLFPINKTK